MWSLGPLHDSKLVTPLAELMTAAMGNAFCSSASLLMPGAQLYSTLMIEILHDLIKTSCSKKYSNPGSIVHLYVYNMMQDFYHEQ